MQQDNSIGSDKANSDIFFVNLTTKDVSPSVSNRANKTKPYIFFGQDNLFPQYISELADNCSIHRALLETKSKFIEGEGFSFIADSDSEIARAEEFVSRLDGEFIQRTATDLAYFGGFYWQAKFDRNKLIAKIKNVDFTSIRWGKFNAEGEIDEYYYTSDWEFATKKRFFNEQDKMFEPKPIAVWGSTDRALTRERGQLLCAKEYRPNKPYYAEPSYLGALNWIEISNQIAEFHKNNLDNGMVGSMHIHLFEDLSDNKKRSKVEKAITKKFSGSENAGKVVVTWSTNENLKTSVEALPVNNSHETFNLLNSKVNEEIVMAHRTPLALAGLKVATGLQSDEAITKNNMEYYQNTVIRPMQKMIESNMDKVLEYNGINAKTIIKPLKPIDLLASESLMLRTMTPNEIRVHVLSLEELENGGDELIQSNNTKTE